MASSCCMRKLRTTTTAANSSRSSTFLDDTGRRRGDVETGERLRHALQQLLAGIQTQGLQVEKQDWDCVNRCFVRGNPPNGEYYAGSSASGSDSHNGVMDSHTFQTLSSLARALQHDPTLRCHVVDYHPPSTTTTTTVPTTSTPATRSSENSAANVQTEDSLWLSLLKWQASLGLDDIQFSVVTYRTMDASAFHQIFPRSSSNNSSSSVKWNVRQGPGSRAGTAFVLGKHKQQQQQQAPKVNPNNDDDVADNDNDDDKENRITISSSSLSFAAAFSDQPRHIARAGQKQGQTYPHKLIVRVFRCAPRPSLRPHIQALLLQDKDNDDDHNGMAGNVFDVWIRHAEIPTQMSRKFGTFVYPLPTNDAPDSEPSSVSLLDLLTAVRLNRPVNVSNTCMDEADNKDYTIEDDGHEEGDDTDTTTSALLDYEMRAYDRYMRATSLQSYSYDSPEPPATTAVTTTITNTTMTSTDTLLSPLAPSIRAIVTPTTTSSPPIPSPSLTTTTPSRPSYAAVAAAKASPDPLSATTHQDNPRLKQEESTSSLSSSSTPDQTNSKDSNNNNNNKRVIQQEPEVTGTITSLNDGIDTSRSDVVHSQHPVVTPPRMIIESSPSESGSPTCFPADNKAVIPLTATTTSIAPPVGESPRVTTDNDEAQVVATTAAAARVVESSTTRTMAAAPPSGSVEDETEPERTHSPSDSTTNTNHPNIEHCMDVDEIAGSPEQCQGAGDEAHEEERITTTQQQHVHVEPENEKPQAEEEEEGDSRDYDEEKNQYDEEEEGDEDDDDDENYEDDEEITIVFFESDEGEEANGRSSSSEGDLRVDDDDDDDDYDEENNPSGSVNSTLFETYRQLAEIVTYEPQEYVVGTKTTETTLFPDSQVDDNNETVTPAVLVSPNESMSVGFVEEENSNPKTPPGIDMEPAPLQSRGQDESSITVDGTNIDASGNKTRDGTNTDIVPSTDPLATRVEYYLYTVDNGRQEDTIMSMQQSTTSCGSTGSRIEDHGRLQSQHALYLSSRSSSYGTDKSSSSIQFTPLMVRETTVEAPEHVALIDPLATRVEAYVSLAEMHKTTQDKECVAELHSLTTTTPEPSPDLGNKVEVEEKMEVEDMAVKEEAEEILNVDAKDPVVPKQEEDNDEKKIFIRGPLRREGTKSLFGNVALGALSIVQGLSAALSPRNFAPSRTNSGISVGFDFDEPDGDDDDDGCGNESEMWMTLWHSNTTTSTTTTTTTMDDETVLKPAMESGELTAYCSSCQRDKVTTEFSKAQMRKKSKRCIRCIQNEAASMTTVS